MHAAVHHQVAGRILFTVLALCLLWLTPQPAAAAPASCKVGAFLTGIHDMDNATGTFRAEMWLWSVCPTKDLEPLKTMEFTNAVSTSGGLDSVLQRGNQWWATRKVSGTFRQDYQLQNYPFDTEALTITVEEAVLDSRDLVYTADTANSKMDPGVAIRGWKLSDFKIAARIIEHPTSYGDPSLKDGTSRYAQLVITLTAERSHWLNFIKAILPIYIAAFLVLMVLNFDVGELFLTRVSVFGTTMFAVVLSFINVERFVGVHEGLFLLDQIHIFALILILSATAWTVVVHIEVHSRDSSRERYLDHWVSRTLQGAYILANVAAIGWAISHGAA